jgi:hypothetical protein
MAHGTITLGEIHHGMVKILTMHLGAIAITLAQ